MVGLGLGDAVVHALRVRKQCLAGHIVRRERIPLLLRRTQQPELQLEAVVVQGGLADDLRQAAFALPPQQVHLEQPETGVHVADGQEEVVVGLRDDVRGAVAFQAYLDRMVEAEQMQGLAADRGVVGHGPGARDRVESGAERRQRPGTEERRIEHRRRHDHRRGSVDGAQATLHRRRQV